MENVFLHIEDESILQQGQHLVGLNVLDVSTADSEYGMN